MAGPIVAPLPAVASPNAAPMEVEELSDPLVTASMAVSTTGAPTQEKKPEPAAILTNPQAADLTASERELASRIKCKLSELSESEFLAEFKHLPNPEVNEWHHVLKLICEELVQESKQAVADCRGGKLWLEDLMSRRRKAQAALEEYSERSAAPLAPTTVRAAAARVVAVKAISVTPVEEAPIDGPASQDGPTATLSKTTAEKPIVPQATSVVMTDDAAPAAAPQTATAHTGPASSSYRETREEAAEYVSKYRKLRYQCAQRLRQKYFSDNYETELRIGDMVVRESSEDPVVSYLTGSEPDWPPLSAGDPTFQPKKKLNLKTEARRA